MSEIFGNNQSQIGMHEHTHVHWHNKYIIESDGLGMMGINAKNSYGFLYVYLKQYFNTHGIK